jgi:hypothetical protein
MTTTKKPRYVKPAADLETQAQEQAKKEEAALIEATRRDPTIQTLIQQAPRGKTKIGASPHFEDVIRLFYSGWTPYDIKDWLKNKGLNVSVVQLYDYYNKHINKNLIPQKPDFLKIVEDQTNNELENLNALSRLQAARIEKLRRIENTMPNQTLPQLTREIQQHKQLQIEIAHLKQELGISPKRPERHEHIIAEIDPMTAALNKLQAQRAARNQDEEDVIDIETASEP